MLWKTLCSAIVALSITGAVLAQDPPLPAEFKLNTDLPAERANAGSPVAQSPHFAIYGTTVADANTLIDALESTYDCFVNTLSWRSPGLPYQNLDPNGPYKTNVFQVTDLPAGIGGTQGTDAKRGIGYLNVASGVISTPDVFIHEFGHVMHYHDGNWVNQPNTGAWWETVANFVADTARTSDICAPSRDKYNQTTKTTSNGDFNKLISNSYQVLVDGTPDPGNYYQAWPFLSYLTLNPDSSPELGSDTLHKMFATFADVPKGSDLGPLNALANVTGASLPYQRVVATYYARLAFADLWNAPLAKAFNRAQPGLDYANLDASGRVLAARQPKYLGASFVPLKGGNGDVGVKVSTAVPGAEYIAKIAVRAVNHGKVRYADVVDGAATVTVVSGEEVMLVVVNAPSQIVRFDPFKIAGTDADKGLDFSVSVTGASL